MSHDIAARIQLLLSELNEKPTILVIDVTNEFRRAVLPKYRDNSGQTSRFRRLCEILDDEFCDQPADTFGPVRLAAVRDILIAAGNSRRYINEQVRDTIRIFKHALSREMIRPEQLVSLQSLAPLKHGEAPDKPPREAVPLPYIEATFPFLSTMLQAMVRIQLATGCRPSEVFGMTPGEIDRTADVWWYRPSKHKTASHAVRKAIPLIGDAREAITPFLLRESGDFCFVTRRGNKWKPSAYRWEIQKAAAKAGIPKWSPYAMRHTAAEVVREHLGLEGAKALLGHTSSVITEKYYAQLSEREALAAAKVAPQIKLR